MVPQASLDKAGARRLLLAHQGLWPPWGLKGKAGIMQWVHRVGAMQYDPLNVFARNHELVLLSRIKGFRPDMLHGLLYRDRLLYDTWDKCMCICPVTDWPYFARTRSRYGSWLSSGDKPAVAVFDRVMCEVRDRGPLGSADLGLNERVDWWWAPTKLSRAALESLYYMGKLVVSNRIGARRVYDLAERCIPPEVLTTPDPNTTEAEYLKWHVKRRIGGVGLLRDKPGDAWLGIGGLKSPERQRAMSELAEAGETIGLDVEGTILYMRREDWLSCNGVLDAKAPKRRAAILAPLDNMLWDRDLVRFLFGFDYVWEVYKPASQRRYGYYVLPVLYGDAFVARIEPVGDTKAGTLTVRNLWWEDGVKRTPAMVDSILECLGSYGAALGLRLDAKGTELGM